jgi:DNA-binding response OmpR family regulator
MTTPLRVLLVEDHPDTRDLLASYLRSGGHEVEVAGTMQAGARGLAERSWDLVLSDIGLPDGSGWDMLRQAQGDRARLAVSMSGFGTREDRARSLAAGFHEHLVKPVDLDVVDRVVARAQAARRTG